MSTELTDEEIGRIDLLHNETHEYLRRIIPVYNEKSGEGDWDIDLIDRVCEAVWNEIKDEGWMTENEFYPFRET